MSDRINAKNQCHFSWPFAPKRAIHLFQFFKIATHYCQIYFHQKHILNKNNKLISIVPHVAQNTPLFARRCRTHSVNSSRPRSDCTFLQPTDLICHLTSQLETTPKQTQHYLPLFMHFSETAQRPCRQYENLQSP